MPEEWIALIQAWAERQTEVQAVYLFGSRAKGHHDDSSDLDLALFLTGNDPGERDGIWICKANVWRVQLTLLLPVKVDLQFCDPETDEIVWPAVQAHGVPLYQRL